MADAGTNTTPTPPVGVIESLAQGFETVAGHLGLLLIPLLIDLLLWVGPRVSLGPGITFTYESILNDPAFSSMMQPEIQKAYADMAAMGKEIPTAYMPIFFPARLTFQPAAGLPFDLEPATWVAHDIFAVGLALVAAWAIGVLVLVLQLSLIGWQVRDGALRLPPFSFKLVMTLVQLAMLLGAAPLIVLLVIYPFQVFASLAGGGLAEVITVVGFFFLMWVLAFTGFTLHGLLMNGRHLIAALADSVRVVRNSTTPTLFMMLAGLTIYWGMNWVWSLAEPDSWLILLAIVGNAFVLTGLIASTFVFYRDHYRYWREVQAAALPPRGGLA